MTTVFAAATAPPASHADQQVFRGLFQDTDRPAPLAARVSELWGVPSARPDRNDQSSAAAPSGSMLDLFKDSGQGS
jgi:hypothetical protein